MKRNRFERQRMLPQLVQNLNLEPAVIQRRRCNIASHVMRESSSLRDINFTTVNTRDLFELFCCYDEHFFEGRLTPIFESKNCQLNFRLSSRMTSTGGMTTYRRRAKSRLSVNRRVIDRQFEIAVSSTLLFNTDFQARQVKVGGLVTEHRLDALQRIFEHELVHLLEMVLWEDSSCARRRFKGIVNRLFGHVESHHQMLTPSESARAEMGIAIGDRVSFHHRGRLMTGFVNGINRRATILVPDKSKGELFDDNRRYQRYYVPLQRLKLKSRNIAG